MRWLVERIGRQMHTISLSFVCCRFDFLQSEESSWLKPQGRGKGTLCVASSLNCVRGGSRLSGSRLTGQPGEVQGRLGRGRS